MSPRQRHQFERFLAQYGEACAQLQMTGGAGDAIEQYEYERYWKKQKSVAKQKLFQLYESARRVNA